MFKKLKYEHCVPAIDPNYVTTLCETTSYVPENI